MLTVLCSVCNVTADSMVESDCCISTCQDCSAFLLVELSGCCQPSMYEAGVSVCQIIWPSGPVGWHHSGVLFIHLQRCVHPCVCVCVVRLPRQGVLGMANPLVCHDACFWVGRMGANVTLPVARTAKLSPRVWCALHTPCGTVAHSLCHTEG